MLLVMYPGPLEILILEWVLINIHTLCMQA